MEKAIVNWHLSIHSFKKEFKNLKFKRELKVNNDIIDLNKFNDLHGTVLDYDDSTLKWTVKLDVT